jgi:hypothetical protein
MSDQVGGGKARPWARWRSSVTGCSSLPGVGPTDNGSVLVALAAHQQPTHTWWPWLLGGAVLMIAVGVVAWVVIRSKRDAAV